MEPEAIGASSVSADFFPVLGVEPIYGRVFLPGEANPGKNPRNATV